MEKTKINIPALIISVLLGISVFAAYLDADRGYITLFIYLFQIIIIFIIDKANKHFGCYLGCTILLALSNIANFVITCVWANMTVAELKAMSIGTTQDMFASIMAPVAVYLFWTIVFVITAIVFIECIISLSMRIYKRKKAQKAAAVLHLSEQTVS